MGVDYTVYVGPFLQCHNPQIYSVYQEKVCTSFSCKNFQKNLYHPFCELCGQPQGTKEVPTKTSSINVFDLMAKIEDVLYPPFGDGYSQWSDENETDIWLPNLKNPRKDAREFSFSPKYDGLIIQELNQSVLEMAEFQEQYKDAIAFLSKSYNDLVKVKWGLISTAH